MPSFPSYIMPQGGGGGGGSTSLTSGQVQSGIIGNAAVVSGSIASGSLASGMMASGFIFFLNNAATLTSGQVTSGFIGDAAVVSGSYASGSISKFKIASGAVNSGQVASGAIIGQAGGGAFNIGSGTIITNDLGSGAIQSGTVASGQIGFGHLANASVKSGTIASGIVGQFGLASGAANSGHISSGSVMGQGAGTVFNIVSGSVNQFDLAQNSVLSGQISSGQIGQNHLASGSVTSGAIASGQVGQFHMASGAVGSGDLGNSSTVSGSIASGQIGWPHLASGSVRSGHVANNAVVSGSIGSGQVSTYSLASGSAITVAQFGATLVSGTAWNSITEEIVSGLVAVTISQSGNIRVAMASVSGRMPAMGIAADNALSGIEVTVYRVGLFQATSGLADYSGFIGQPLIVGRSGQIVSISGSFNSGGLLSGDVLQFVGMAWNSGAILANLSVQSVSGAIGLGSGVVQSGNVGNNAVTSGNLASGIVSQFKLASGAVNSGQVGSGAVIGQAGGGAFNIGSGTITTNDMGSGSVVSGLVASGQIGQFHLSSGSVTSGAISSGVVSRFALSSGAANSGQVASGAVMGQAGGGAFNIASGTITTNDIGSGAILSGNIASGQVGSTLIASGGVLSGNIASGQIGPFHLASGAVRSGHIASGSIGQFHMASGAVGSGDLGNTSVVSGSLASGILSQFAMASGAVNSGVVASGAVQGEGGGGAFNIASGTVGTFDLGQAVILSGQVASGVLGSYHLASGAMADRSQYSFAFVSGLSHITAITEEIVSGTRTVCLSQSGNIRIAMASVSGRYPAIGIVFENVASGIQANVVSMGGAYQLTSGMADYSGWVGRVLVMGRSGQIVSMSGSFNSGGLLSGDVYQIVGNAFNSGAIQVDVGPPSVSGGPSTGGSVTSGSVGTLNLASGATPWQWGQYASGISPNSPITEESVSGIRAVCLSQSGNIRIAMASVSGRMPAVGVVFDNVASGIAANVINGGTFIGTSGMQDYSGYLGQLLWVGRSGQVVSASGSFNSGGLLSGDVSQPIGVVYNSGGGSYAVAAMLQFVIGTVASGNIGSGQIGSYHLSSGTMADRSQNSYSAISGLGHITVVTEEIVSGVRAVCISPSGNIRVAMASVSGRMPAIGVVFENVASGLQANVVTQGAAWQVSSGMADYSGYLGTTLWVGRSGQIVSVSGSFNSGGLNLASGGDFVQRAGTAVNSGAFLINMGLGLGQSILIGTTDVVDAINRGFAL